MEFIHVSQGIKTFVLALAVVVLASTAFLTYIIIRAIHRAIQRKNEELERTHAERALKWQQTLAEQEADGRFKYFCGLVRDFDSEQTGMYKRLKKTGFSHEDAVQKLNEMAATGAKRYQEIYGQEAFETARRKVADDIANKPPRA